MLRRLFLFIVDGRIVTAVISVNTIAIFLILSFPDQAIGQGLHQWGWLHWADYACALYFVIEATIRMCLFGPSGYLNPPRGKWWNRFDFAIALLSLPLVVEPLLSVLEIPEGYEFVVVLRLTRIFRLFRFFSFIPNVGRLTSSMPRALMTSTGIVLALGVGMIITGLGTTLFFGKDDQEHFGTPFVAILSMVQVMTLEGWGEMVGSVTADYTSWQKILVVRMFFLVCVVGFGVVGLSLATAVLVDEMRSDDDAGRRAEMKEILDEVRSLRKELADRESQES